MTAIRSCSLVLVLACTGTVSDLMAQWTTVTTATTPSPRRAGAMAFDGSIGNLVMHGGLVLSPNPILDETWSFNGTTWTQLQPATVPPPRWGHTLVRDTRRNRLLMFGGRSPTFYQDNNETWTWNGTDWSRLSTPTSPPVRHNHGMVFDHQRDRMVLFGGVDGLGARNDTWEFDGATWSESLPATAPPARESMAMAYDRARRVAVLFGGIDALGAGVLGDHWEYDGRDWVELQPPTTPGLRYRAGCVYDDQRQRVVLFGGFDGQALSQQTFEFDGTEWAQPAGGLFASNFGAEMFVAYDPQRFRTVAFGGASALGFSNETWRYQGAPTAIFGPYGQGCPHSAGISTIRANPPVLGQPFAIEVTDVPLTTPLCLLAAGFANAIWNGLDLPVPLSPFGLPGCWLEVEPEAVFSVSASAGSATATFQLPTNPALLNQPYFVQAFVPDQGASNGLGATSRAGHGVLGN